MRRFLPTFILITLVLAIYPFIGKEESGDGIKGLPWQIEIQPDGSTTVFGVTAGQTTLGEAVAHLGDDWELAVMAAEGEAGSLEMYYGRYRAGLLSARLVLGADTDADTLERMRANAAGTEILKSGARKYVLSEQDHAKALRAVVRTIACIPSVNLKHDMIVKRFGEPDELIAGDGQVTHYLYSSKGLDVILSDEGRDVLQYVAPKDFDRLREPLVRQAG